MEAMPVISLASSREFQEIVVPLVFRKVSNAIHSN